MPDAWFGEGSVNEYHDVINLRHELRIVKKELVQVTKLKDRCEVEVVKLKERLSFALGSYSDVHNKYVSGHKERTKYEVD